MTAQSAEPLAGSGMSLCPATLIPEHLVQWKSAVDARYEELEIARRNSDTATISRLAGARERFAPTASSFTIGAIKSEADIRELLTAVATASAGAWAKCVLGDRLLCNLDQSWVRRQYAPSRYPPLHAPHGWHQDGALQFDFLSHPNEQLPPDAMLNMVTCWISLEPSGLEAPGLELIAERLQSLLAPSELRAESVQARFTTDKFWRPILQPGDALLFRGNILHRTHVAPHMTNDRTSIELRLFSAEHIPDRLKSDCFIPFD